MNSVRRAAVAQYRRVDGMFRTATASLRSLPDFLIVGEAKCGTTSLYDDIVRHPSVEAACIKEVHFFDLGFERGLSWYKAQFPIQARGRGRNGASSTFQTGEASPYYLFHPHAPRRIRQVLPGVKAIAMLRNPVERAYSHYQHEFRKGREALGFEEAIAREPERLHGERERMIEDERYNSKAHRRHSYLARGIYINQLENWLQHFDRDQLLVIKSEDYFAAPGATLKQVLKFLELPQWESPHFAKRNVGSYAPIDAGLRARLAAYFAPHNTRLNDFLGVDFGW
jgi:hypothetical protein